MPDVPINHRVSLPESELQWSFGRSGGPGGQHANTSDTRVTLRFDVDASAALSPADKARIHAQLANRITAEGQLLLTGNEYRSQTRNREAALARLTRLLADALVPPKPRRPTRPSRAARRRRLDAKRRRSEKKALRNRVDPP